MADLKSGSDQSLALIFPPAQAAWTALQARVQHIRLNSLDHKERLSLVGCVVIILQQSSHHGALCSG
jgi:hypothetical protein